MTKEKKRTVEESAKTRKAREKLRKRLEALEKKITPQALEKKLVEIHRWIALHAAQRVVLRSKTIALFDENQNTAEVSRKISLLADQIRADLSFQTSEAEKNGAKDLLKKLMERQKKSISSN